MKYDPEQEKILATLLILENVAWTVFPERRPDVEKTISALKNPNIGGLFQTNGGTWLFDRDSGRLYLTFSHDIDDSITAIKDSLKKLEEVGPEWTLNWIGQIGMIAHGQEPAPKKPVTIENNSYR